MLFSVKLANFSDTDTVDAVDLAIYCENAYGEIMYPDDDESGYIRYFTLSKKYKPGKSGYSGYCRMDGLSDAVNVSIALVRYHVKGGDTYDCGSRLVTDPMDKYTWLTWTLD